MTKDYYKILGVEKNAAKEDIKKAYKKLAKKYHPDLNKSPDSSDKFKEINEAAAVLTDPQKRQQYDQFGTADPGQGFGGFDFRDFAGQGGFDFGKIFEQLFGGMGGFGGFNDQRRSAHGNNLAIELSIDLEDTAFGATKTIEIDRISACEKCSGSGAKSKSDIETCPDCNGAGVVRHTRRTAFGIFATTGPCSKCSGTGQFIKNQCLKCHGKGIEENEEKIKIKIPPGAYEGLQLRVSGKGNAGPRGIPPGDLYVILHMNPHKIFERNYNDLSVELPITFAQACLGDKVDIPLLKGKKKIKIPAGTQSGTILRLEGEGIQHVRGLGKGDLNIHLKIITPKKLTKKQKELLEEFDKGTKPKKKGFSFFGLI